MSDEAKDGEEPLELPPSTAPANLTMSYSCFASEDDAHRCHAVLSQCLATIGSVLNLERLDGVTAAYDYAAALARLDRGFGASTTLKPSSELAQGIAMAPVVLRDGVVKAHMVFDAAFIGPLADPAHEHWKLTFYTVAHECAHVHDLRARDLAFPGVLLHQKLKDIEEVLRYQTSSACWEEYAACRFSASFYPEQIARYEQTFVQVLDVARERADQRIRDYVAQGDQQRVVLEVAAEYRGLMTYASYVLGHLAGAGLDLEAIPTAEARLDGHWFAPFFVQLESELDWLWQRYGQWKDWSEFDSLGQIGRLLMLNGGVDLRRADNDQLFLGVDESRGKSEADATGPFRARAQSPR